MLGIDAARFRQVLGHFPTGVTVITANPDSGPVGLTIGSFTSVSLDPPLVGFLPGKESDSWPGIEKAGVFCVNILAEDQHELCWGFAKEGDNKFHGVEWRPAPSGSPVLDDVIAWIDCDVHAVIDAGDHWFVLGLVRELEIERDHGPMLFFRGKLGAFHIP
jgi:3-hydroxy-9,10-secoandrosta-1,3,5(10)-triene-9,17-dione monooxygenase reductase component